MTNPSPPTESQNAPWTIKRLLDWTSQHFAKSDPDQPRLRAEILLAEAIGCARIDLYTRFDTEPAPESLSRFRDWVKRHARGEPVAYLVGYREFFSLRFEVTPDVLIPRPETEHVVLRAIEAAKAIGRRPLQVADVGTGSGCLAITLAKQIPDSRIAATDICATALAIAARNVQRHGVQEQVTLHQGDLLDAVPVPGQFDVVVSNPPYIGTDEQATVAESVRRYEPQVALFAGNDGMAVIRRLLDQMRTRLSAGGLCIVEISPLIADACRQEVDTRPFLEWVGYERDFAGLQRVLVARRVAE